METKIKGKAIIGIAMAAVIVVALMAMVPTASAVTTRSVNSTSNVVIIGETSVTFHHATTGGVNMTDATLKGPTDKVGDVPKNRSTIAFGTILDTTDYESELISATYLVYNTTSSYEVVLNNPLFTLKTVNAYTDGADVGSCVKDDTIWIDLKTNLETISGSELQVDYKITGPDGVARNDAGEGLNSAGNDVLNFSSTDAVGEYTVYVKTSKTLCNGLDVSSSSITFNVIESGVTLTSDVATQTKTGEVIFTGTTNPLTRVNLTVSDGTTGNVYFVGGKGQLSADHIGNETTGLINVTSLKTGAFSFVCNFTDTGSYTIKATNADGKIASVSVDIVSPSATVTTDKTAYCVGQKVTISGTANVGDSVAIAIDDVWKKDEATIKEDGTFSYKWTSSGVVGSRKVEIWIQPTTIATGKSGDETETVAADATTSFLLSAQTLTAEMDKTVMALGDKVTISGTANGVSEVEIVIIAPKGAGGKTLVAGTSATNGYEAITTTVSSTDFSFSKKRTSSTDAAAGTHWVGVFTRGLDNYYGDNASATTIDLAVAPYTLTGKTKEQIVEILKAVTTDKIGSDDLMWEGEIKLEAASISLDTIADVAVGDTLDITGACNRELYAILVTVTGPSPATAVVGTASVTVSDGAYSTSIDTTGWATGTYTVKADDGDSHIAETTVGIVTEVAPAPTATPKPTAKPTAAPAPTAKPTAEPTAEPTATPEPPGFEAVFAIAGLLSIAYLVLRKRRE